MRELERRRRDIAALEAQLARRESRDQAELIVHWRRDFTRTFVNAAYCSYFGADEAELLGGSVLDPIVPEHRAQMREKVARLTAEHGVEIDEYRVVRPDGTVAWQQWVDRAIVEGGEVIELRSVGRDITDRVELDGRLRREHTMEAIGLLAGGVAQDFQNLLLVVLTRVELAREAVDPAPHLEEIAAAANRAAMLNRQLLTWTRSQILDFETIDLRDVLGRLLPVLRSLVPEEVQVHLERSAAPCGVEVDVGRIDQVIMQLTANARDAMPDGGRIVIEVAPLRVERGEPSEGGYPHPPPPGPYVRLAVTDTGPSIADEDLDRVFEPFHGSKRGEGVGLGLSRVWGIVRQHRGFVGVRNVVPRGVRFEILLPGEEIVPTSDVPRGGKTARSREAVLLVEDDAAVRRVMRAALEARGYTVTEACNAEESRRAFENGLVPDLVVLDVVLPGTPGPAHFRELLDRFPTLRCVFVSGYAEEKNVARLLGPRVAYLEKPFSFSDLHEAIGRTKDTMSDIWPLD